MKKHLDELTLTDWRLRADQAPQPERSLEGMEGNITHLIADLMKAKGHSWSP